MSRRHKDPSYRLHKASGQGIVTLPDGLGRRRDYLLGPFQSDQSKEKYHKIMAKWRANGGLLLSANSSSELSINEVILAFWQQAKKRYSPESRELEMFRLTFKPLKRMFGDLPIKDFGPRCLKTLQQVMADGSWMSSQEQADYRKQGYPLGLCRNTVNRRIVRVRTLVKWAESEELAPKGTYHALQTVTCLPLNATSVRHTDPVQPATWDQIDAVVKACRRNQNAATMLQLQWWSGMRSCEVRIMRLADIDRSDPECWLYRPVTHKNQWRGQDRVVALGPRCIELLTPLLFQARLEMDGYIFRPRKRGKATKCYTAFAYCQAIRRAAQRAGIEEFHPYMARHGCKMRIEGEVGSEAARTVLGHKSIKTTELYGKIDVAKAKQAMAKYG